MKEKVLLAGASGALGLEFLKILHQENIPVRALVHSAESVNKVSQFTEDIVRVDASEGTAVLDGVTKGITIFVSTLGKSVSLFTNRGSTFLETDYYANSNLLDNAVKDGVRRVVYVSIKGAEELINFEIARSHKMFEEAIEATGLGYTIIRPVGFFSGLHDLAIMAKRKIIPIIGDGKARTNSIHQKDLALVVLENLFEGPKMREIGGPVIHTRMEMAEIIKKKFGGTILKIPEKVAEWGMFLPEAVDEQLSAKLNYFKFITTNDMIGEITGKITFEDYIQNLDKNDLP